MNYFLALDMGGTNLKTALVSEDNISARDWNFEIFSTPSKASVTDNCDAIAAALEKTLSELPPGDRIAAVGISTAGIVNYAGNGMERVSDHLAALRNPEWIKKLSDKFSVPVTLINDADAAMIAARYSGLIAPEDCCGLLAVGTGVGFSVIRKSHRIRPGRELALLGSIRTPVGDYNSLAGLTRLKDTVPNGDLKECFKNHDGNLEKYLDDLTAIITTAAILYQIDRILLIGGVVNAAMECGFDLEADLNLRLRTPAPELRNPVRVAVSGLSTKLQLAGAALLAWGSSNLPSGELPKVAEMVTEQPLFPGLELTDIPGTELAEMLNDAEKQAAENLSASVNVIGNEAEKIAEHFRAGGRLIYLGAGTSGRLAALDAVELPCTYGIEESRAVALVAGGNDDAALTIESDGEEDASSVPELLLLDLTPQDTVIGISASGSAYYVRSGISFARQCGCRTIMIQESEIKRVECDCVIALHSGAELVAGSTRMKAGTATKKALNFLTTIAMIKLGRTRNSRMSNMMQLNEKLRRRAETL